jgi:hypothetical protein
MDALQRKYKKIVEFSNDPIWDTKGGKKVTLNDVREYSGTGRVWMEVGSASFIWLLRAQLGCQPKDWIVENYAGFTVSDVESIIRDKNIEKMCRKIFNVEK